MESFIVLTPSRGLVHSRTIEVVEANRERARAAGHVDRGWRLSHDLPIPDCDEAMVRAGLDSGADAFWFVEEDMVLDDRALLRSFETLRAHPIAALDYPVGEAPTSACISRDAAGHIYWCGLGATLIRRSLFEELAPPWFRADVTYRIIRMPGQPMRLEETAQPSAYGGQDIYFFRRALDAGYTIGEVAGPTGGQAHLRELGKRHTNQGAHRIEVVTAIERQQWA